MSSPASQYLPDVVTRAVFGALGLDIPSELMNWKLSADYSGAPPLMEMTVAVLNAKEPEKVSQKFTLAFVEEQREPLFAETKNGL